MPIEITLKKCLSIKKKNFKKIGKENCTNMFEVKYFVFCLLSIQRLNKFFIYTLIVTIMFFLKMGY